MSDPATREDLGRLETALLALAKDMQDLRLKLESHDVKLTGRWDAVKDKENEAVEVLKEICDHQKAIAPAVHRLASANGSPLKGKQLMYLILGMTAIAVAAAFGSSVFTRLLDAAGR